MKVLRHLLILLMVCTSCLNEVPSQESLRVKYFGVNSQYQFIYNIQGNSAQVVDTLNRDERGFYSKTKYPAGLYRLVLTRDFQIDFISEGEEVPIQISVDSSKNIFTSHEPTKRLHDIKSVIMQGDIAWSKYFQENSNSIGTNELDSIKAYHHDILTGKVENEIECLSSLVALSYIDLVNNYYLAQTIIAANKSRFGNIELVKFYEKRLEVFNCK